VELRRAFNLYLIFVVESTSVIVNVTIEADIETSLQLDCGDHVHVCLRCFFANYFDKTSHNIYV
jgi:hypothetical protein